MEIRTIAEQIFLSGVEGVLPDKLIRTQVKVIDNTLYISNLQFSLVDFNHIYVIGAGKASALMAKEIESILGANISKGHIVVKYGSACQLKVIKITEAAHPTPDLNGVFATNEILKIANQAGENDLVICLISGGASSLLADFPENSTLDDLIATNLLLLKSGADIKEMNTVRKHLSKVKGGQLAKAIYPAKLVSLILSDVIGDPIDVIASGPTSPDLSTFEDAMIVLEKYKLSEELPISMINYLKKGILNLVPETPKVGDPIFCNARNLIIGSNRIALEAAKNKAVELGFNTFILTDKLEGDLIKAAEYVIETALRIKNDSQLKKPVCLLFGGEPTIKVTGKGLGGRNQHLALYCATKLKGKEGITILCAGTDGNDGPTDVAGAIVNSQTVSLAMSGNIDSQMYLDAYDSYHFFKQTGEHIITGSTLTNVMDIIIVIVE
ncbi:MAG TPA: glycerate kinase [Paludibacter sp.]